MSAPLNNLLTNDSPHDWHAPIPPHPTTSAPPAPPTSKTNTTDLSSGTTSFFFLLLNVNENGSLYLYIGIKGKLVVILCKRV